MWQDAFSRGRGKVSDMAFTSKKSWKYQEKMKRADGIPGLTKTNFLEGVAKSNFIITDES